MGNVFIALMVAFCISFYAIPIIIRIAKEKNLYDVPDERKIHINLIPSLGGIGIFGGFILSFLIFSNGLVPVIALESYMAAFLLIFFVGIKDDILTISPVKKLVGQCLVAAILIFKSGLVLKNMYGFLNIFELHDSVAYFLTAATIVVILNAFNLIDGVDGLAGSISIVCAAFFGVYFYLINDFTNALLAFSFIGSTISFLIYNFSHSKKIFMGDTGSMLSGTVNAILAIEFINKSAIHQTLNLTATPAIGFGILMIPLLDTLRVFALRMSKGKSPFAPDRNHLHHILLDKGFSHKKITLTLSLLAILGATCSYFGQPLGTTFLIAIQLASFFLFVAILSIKKSTKKKKENLTSSTEISEIKASNNPSVILSTSNPDASIFHKN